jgi:hypothetical protein
MYVSQLDVWISLGSPSGKCSQGKVPTTHSASDICFSVREVKLDMPHSKVTREVLCCTSKMWSSEVWVGYLKVKPS